MNSRAGFGIRIGDVLHRYQKRGSDAVYFEDPGSRIWAYDVLHNRRTNSNPDS
jgi:hypothetical protein